MINLGIISPSEIAYRRFMPALERANCFKYIGVAMANSQEWFGDADNISEKVKQNQYNIEFDKSNKFVEKYDGVIFKSYQDLIDSPIINAVYIPLPPALHYKWAKKALQAGKHVLIEKPSTCYLKDTEDLISVARSNKLALHENYMFIFHDQIKVINDIIEEEKYLGTIRLYRITFGFPKRAMTDFRYNKKLGGGALLDTGGYCIKYASLLLGPTAKIVSASVVCDNDFNVDISGTATMKNHSGITAQLAFGMDNDYRCDIEIWGSKGTLISNRILTAPEGYKPTYILKQNQEYTEHELPIDDTFKKSILKFYECIVNDEIRNENYEILFRQSSYVDDFRKINKL